MTKEELQVWKQNPITKQVYQILKEQKEALVNSLVNGATLTGNAGSTAEATGKLIGTIYGADMLLEMEVEDEEPKRS